MEVKSQKIDFSHNICYCHGEQKKLTLITVGLFVLCSPLFQKECFYRMKRDHICKVCEMGCKDFQEDADDK